MRIQFLTKLKLSTSTAGTFLYIYSSCFASTQWDEHELTMTSIGGEGDTLPLISKVSHHHLFYGWIFTSTLCLL